MIEQRDAALIVAWLVAAFPNVALEEHSVDLWVRLVGSLKDTEAATKTALEYATNGEKFPTFPEFRRSYLRLKQRTTEGVAIADLEAGPALECPGWVRMYDALRKAGDERAFPEQQRGFVGLGYEWPPEAGVISDEEINQWLAENPVVDGEKHTVLSSVDVLRSID